MTITFLSLTQDLNETSLSSTQISVEIFSPGNTGEENLTSNCAINELS